MSKLSREELQKIIAEDMPGYRIADEASAGVTDSGVQHSTSGVEGETPDLSELRIKYLREKYLGLDSNPSDTGTTEEAEEAAEANPDEDQIIAVKPEQTGHPWDRSTRPKATVVSAKEKKVIGQQG